MIRQLSVAAIIAGLVLTPVGVASATPLDVSGNFLSFTNPGDLDLGDEATVGDTIDYEDVLTVGGVTVDARVTVMVVDGSINVVDRANTPDASPWPYIFSQLRFQQEEVGSGKVRYRIEFTDSATGDPVVMTGLRVNVRDVDETQYVQASNVASYSLSSSPVTTLTVHVPSEDVGVAEGEIRFASTSLSSDASDEENWVQLNFDDVSAFDVELGQGDYDQFEHAYYFLDFSEASWTVEPTVTDTPSLSRDNLADTGLEDASLILNIGGAIALLAVGVGLRRRRIS